VPRKPQDPRDPRQIPEAERYYFLEERYPKYGNLVPRDIATREIFNVCTHEGLSVEIDRMCVYLDLTHLPRATLDLKLAGILEIYEKFQGVDPRDVPMKIFPAVHYSMGGLWCDYERTAAGGLKIGSPRNQATNIPGLYALGECDYQYHGANRLGANSLLSCIFSGLMIAPSVQNWTKSVPGGAAADQPSSLYEAARKQHQHEHDALLKRTSGGENPYLLHQELGQVMTKAATVVRFNATLKEAYGKVSELAERAERCSLSDSGNWTNQNVVFTKALKDMFPLAKAILKGALQRDECRGAHYKPDFALPGLTPDATPAEHLHEAEVWCDKFEENTKKWLKSTIATLRSDGEPEINYEEVDTSLITPRPRLYGLVGAEAIEEVWKKRQASKSPNAATDGNGSKAKTHVASASH
jgi:succinate dehydrogenase / fumarate reductase flavoprotein subunit